MDPAGHLFHATPVDNLASILEDGLTPNEDREPTFDGYPVDGRLFLAATEAAARFYARTIEDGFERECALLWVPAVHLRVSPDGFGNPGDAFASEVIPADRIEMLVDGGWEPLEAAVALVSRPGPGR